MTSYDLSKHVNALMSRIFTDYAGCRVYVDQSQTANGYQMMDPNHPVHVDLYFALGKQKNPTDKTVYAFRQISDQVKEAAGAGKSNYVAACIGHNVAVTQNKSSEITQEAMDILGSMLWYNVAMGLSAKPSAKEFNNKGIVVEASTTQGNTPYMTPNTQKIVYNIVRYVDINSILNTLFTDEEEEEQLIYQVTPIKPIIPMPTDLTREHSLISVTSLAVSIPQTESISVLILIKNFEGEINLTLNYFLNNRRIS